MTATPNKIIWATILVTRVSKADKEASQEHVAETWETRVNKAVLAAAASKASKGSKASKASKVSKEAHQIVEVSEVRKEGFPPIVVLPHH